MKTFVALALMSVLLLAPVATASDQTVMRFLESPQTSLSLVRLSDLVEILSGNSQSLDKLMDMPLGPAPRAGKSQAWHSRDLLQHLELKGIHPASIRWSGNDRVELKGIETPDIEITQTLKPAFLNDRIIEQAQNNVGLAITEYLNLRNGERIDWRIQVEIPDRHVGLLQGRRNIASIGGGQEPWLGEQEFLLQIKNSGKLMSLPVRALVALPPMVVVSKRAIRREEILTVDALGYAALPNSNANADRHYFTSMDELIGKQAKRAISTGLPLTHEVIGDPLVVTRNDVVEVESIAGGIVVRSAAKSLGSGAVGDLIEIEMPSRHRIYATVVGQSLVRVSAVPARSAPNR